MVLERPIPERPEGISRRGLVAASAAALAACTSAPKDQWSGRRARPQLMRADRMFKLAQALAVAKSRQDVPAALKFLPSPDMVLEVRQLDRGRVALARMSGRSPVFLRPFQTTA